MRGKGYFVSLSQISVICGYSHFLNTLLTSFQIISHIMSLTFPRQNTKTLAFPFCLRDMHATQGLSVICSQKVTNEKMRKTIFWGTQQSPAVLLYLQWQISGQVLEVPSGGRSDALWLWLVKSMQRACFSNHIRTSESLLISYNSLHQPKQILQFSKIIIPLLYPLHFFISVYVV